MKKKLLAIAVLCLWFVGAQAQEDKLTRLMSEREQLVLEYQFYNQQNSNFWGKKSKNDLLSIIGTLKKIINKDSELIGAVKEASLKKIAESTVESRRENNLTVQDQRQIDNHIKSFKSQIKILEVEVKKREQTIRSLEEQLKTSKDFRYGKDKVIAILAVTAFIMFLYAVFLQIRLNKVNKPKPRKKKA